MVKRGSSLHMMHFHCSRVQWKRALHHSSRRLALCMVFLGLCAAARPWKPISRSLLVGKVASYLREIAWRLHGCVLDFIHLSATSVGGGFEGVSTYLCIYSVGCFFIGVRILKAGNDHFRCQRKRKSEAQLGRKSVSVQQMAFFHCFAHQARRPMSVEFGQQNNKWLICNVRLI